MNYISDIDIGNEWDQAKWKAFVSDCENNRKLYGKNYIQLAYYAAFPIVLSSDLLYKIYLNFIKPQKDADGEYPIWQASEFLFSVIVREVSYDLYEIYPAIRDALKLKLKEILLEGSPITENIRMANFMQEYIEKCGNKISTDTIRKAQELNYKIEKDPYEAIKEVFKILANPSKTINHSHARYLLSWGKKNLESSQESAKGLNAEIFRNLERLLEELEANDSDRIVDALKNFDINQTDSGYKFQIPIEAYNKIDFTTNSVPFKKRKLFALIVGINKYADNPLSGCINDANAIEEYLLDTEIEPEIVKLLDEQATKAAITEAFKKVLSQAESQDSVLFYFAGNGTTTRFSDQSRRISVVNTVVCYNDGQHSVDEFILPLKEIKHGYFSGLNAENNTAIFDCSFVTDNSRRAFQKKRYTNCRERAIKESNVVEGGILDFQSEQSIKFDNEKDYFELFASENDESTLEVAGRGVFTKKLIEYLEDTDGQISYSGLIGRVRQVLKVKYDQRPIINSSLSENAAKEKLFLNRSKSGTIGEISFDTNDDSWYLNLGSIHGISKIQKIRLKDNKNIGIREITIDKIFTSYCSVNIDDSTNLNKKETYIAILEGLEIRELKIHIKHFNGSLEAVQAIIENLLDQKEAHYILENEEAEADYTLHFRNEKVYITLPKEIYRPLIEPFELSHPNTIANITRALKQISQWHFVKNLKGDLNSNEYPLQLNVSYDNNEKIEIVNGEVNLQFRQENNRWRNYIAILLKNLAQKPYFVNIIFLQADFGISTNMFRLRQDYLEGHGEEYVKYKNESILPIYLGKTGKEYNWQNEVEYIKIILTEKKLDIEALSAKGLPKQFLHNEQTREMGFIEEKDLAIDLHNFITQDICLKFTNPLYNQIDKNTLREMLTFDKTSDFALGIYYDVKKDDLLRPIYVLKPEIKLSNDDEQLYR